MSTEGVGPVQPDGGAGGFLLKTSVPGPQS